MKNWFWIPLAGIVGVVAGSWAPREDLARFKETVREERTQKKASGVAGFDAFARLANIPDVAKRQPKARTNELARSVRHLAPVSGGNRQTNLADLEKFCTHIAFVRDGKVAQTAALADLTADGSSLEDKYLVQFKT